MRRVRGQLASAVPSAPTATGRPDHVLVPVMLAARMLPTARTIDCPVLPHTWATKSVVISLVRAGETAAARADVAVRELTSRIIHYASLPSSLARWERPLRTTTRLTEERYPLAAASTGGSAA